MRTLDCCTYSRHYGVDKPAQHHYATRHSHR